MSSQLVLFAPIATEVDSVNFHRDLVEELFTSRKGQLVRDAKIPLYTQKIPGETEDILVIQTELTPPGVGEGEVIWLGLSTIRRTAAPVELDRFVSRHGLIPLKIGYQALITDTWAFTPYCIPAPSRKTMQLLLIDLFTETADSSVSETYGFYWRSYTHYKKCVAEAMRLQKYLSQGTCASMDARIICKVRCVTEFNGQLAEFHLFSPTSEMDGADILHLTSAELHDLLEYWWESKKFMWHLPKNGSGFFAISQGTKYTLPLTGKRQVESAVPSFVKQMLQVIGAISPSIAA